MGQKDGIAKKPAPIWCLKPERVGQQCETSVWRSEVDIATATNAGMDCIVAHGDFAPENRRAGGKVFADSPLDILTLI